MTAAAQRFAREVFYADWLRSRVHDRTDSFLPPPLVALIVEYLNSNHDEWCQGMSFLRGWNGAPYDSKKAAAIFKSMADEGSPMGASAYGEMVLTGRGGVTKSTSIAKQLFQHAAYLGDPNGQRNLAHLYSLHDDPDSKIKVRSTDTHLPTGADRRANSSDNRPTASVR
jgi:hypothetical protein